MLHPIPTLTVPTIDLGALSTWTHAPSLRTLSILKEPLKSGPGAQKLTGFPACMDDAEGATALSDLADACLEGADFQLGSSWSETLLITSLAEKDAARSL